MALADSGGGGSGRDRERCVSSPAASASAPASPRPRSVRSSHRAAQEARRRRTSTGVGRRRAADLGWVRRRGEEQADGVSEEGGSAIGEVDPGGGGSVPMGRWSWEVAARSWWRQRGFGRRRRARRRRREALAPVATGEGGSEYFFPSVPGARGGESLEFSGLRARWARGPGPACHGHATVAGGLSARVVRHR